ncbi:hypothetical protein NVP1228O_64 [Vibrio phage 1.228.O._10N.261.49.C1]
MSESNPVGRPTKYKECYADIAAKACKLGATDVDLAEMFSVNQSTINEWKHRHPEFSESLKSGKRHCDAKVEDALYSRALGYEYEEHKEEVSEQGKKVTITKKQQAPDTTAQIFWLKNRQPERWRDKQQVEHSSVEPLVIVKRSE